MTYVTGKSVSKGIAIGKIKVWADDQNLIVRRKISNVEAELGRFENARLQAKAAISELSKTCADSSISSIFSTYTLLLDDVTLVETITNKITREKVNAEYAVAVSADMISLSFANVDDDTFKSKGNDIKDLSERLINILQGKDNPIDLGNEPVILLADDLTPSQTVKLDRSKLLALATKQGSYNSHVAIIARSLSIPALVGVEVMPNCTELDGRTAILDGYKGLLIADPSEDELCAYENSMSSAEADTMNCVDGGTAVYANINTLDDIESVLAGGAQGIGLFRTEFLYMEKNDFPSEDEQFEAYKEILEAMNGKKVIIRTLDIGADKKLDYLGLEKEENPALGYRAIRISLTQPEILKSQLRALHRASAFGNLAIMYPMIISVDEVLKIKEISAQVREELTTQGYMPGKVEEGIMIETPAAAIMSDELAKLVDFFSIGTNDLAQYTLAIDRQNPNLDDFFNPKHPAVMRLIKQVADNAHRAGISVGICGELASDTSLTKLFADMGIDELSVSPSCVGTVIKALK